MGYKQDEHTALYEKLRYHIVSYGDGIDISLECNDCGCVIFDTDLYDLIGRET